VKNSVVPSLMVKAVAALDPTGVTAALTTIYNGLDWFSRNAPKLVDLINKTLNLIQTAAGSTQQQVADQIKSLLQQSFPPLLDLGATYAGLGGVPKWLADTIASLDLRQYVKAGIQKLWQELVRAGNAAVASLLSSGSNTSGRRLTQDLTFAGTHTLYIAAVPKPGGGQPSDVEFVLDGNPLRVWMDAWKGLGVPNVTRDAEAALALATRIAGSAAHDLLTANGSAPLPLTASLSGVNSLATQLTSLLSNLSCLAACFAAGMPIRTPDGFKPIEQLVKGDLVLARDEHDPDGPVELRLVEETFRRLAEVLELCAGGRLIRTTGEHPFYVRGAGWCAANQLAVGDELATDKPGQWLAVEAVHDTGCYETVYNVRVAEHHTYFVGEGAEGVSVWSHNTCYDDWINTAFVQWKSEPAVGRALANVPDDKGKALFRMWNDTYQDLLKKNKQAARVAFIPQWETLTKTEATTGVWTSVYDKFKQLEPQGELARRRAGNPPLPELDRIARQEALQVICTYEKNTKGNLRDYGPVAIVGRPQNTDKTRNHQATVAYLVADYIVDPKKYGPSDTIYMDQSINTVLKDLGVTGVPEMDGEGTKPDIIRVRPDGKLDIIEIQSKASQNDDYMEGLKQRIEEWFQTNCPGRLGSVDWKQVTKTEADLYGVLLPR
jgi:hypothetical protein